MIPLDVIGVSRFTAPHHLLELTGEVTVARRLRGRDNGFIKDMQGSYRLWRYTYKYLFIADFHQRYTLFLAHGKNRYHLERLSIDAPQPLDTTSDPATEYNHRQHHNEPYAQSESRGHGVWRAGANTVTAGFLLGFLSSHQQRQKSCKNRYTTTV